MSRQSLILKGVSLAFLGILLAGCAHSIWRDRMNQFVGTPVEQHLDVPACRPDCGNRFWGPTIREGKFEKIVSEENGERLYITWSANCKYSIYVSPDGIIRSWRYETETKDSCVVR